MAHRVTWHVRLLCPLKCLRKQQISELYRYDAVDMLSCMTLDVKNIHSVVHHKDKLFTVLNYQRNFGNATKEGVERATHRAVYYITDPNSWYPVPERAVILTAIPAIVNRYHQYRWHHRACRSWGTGHKQRWQELEFPRRTSIRELFSPTNRSASNALTSRSNKKTVGNETKRKMECLSTIPRVMMVTFHLWKERLIFTSEEVPASEEVFVSTAELCSVNSSLSPLLWNNEIAVTFCVLCTRWHCYLFLWYQPVCTDTFVRDRILTEGSRYHV